VRGGGIKRGRSATEPLFAVRESMRGGAVGLPLSEDALFGNFLGVTRKLRKEIYRGRNFKPMGNNAQMRPPPDGGGGSAVQK